MVHKALAVPNLPLAPSAPATLAFLASSNKIKSALPSDLDKASSFMIFSANVFDIQCLKKKQTNKVNFPLMLPRKASLLAIPEGNLFFL